jgi:hypothetical protein
MINRAMDIIFVDSFAFAINVTLGAVLQSKICNYSWEGKVISEPQTEEINSDSSEKNRVDLNKPPLEH